MRKTPFCYLNIKRLQKDRQDTNQLPGDLVISEKLEALFAKNKIKKLISKTLLT